MDLTTFLVTAKSRTYAAGDSAEEELVDGARQFVYHDGPFKYRDRYYGFNPFGGEEVVWQDGKPIWCMNYWGKVITQYVSGAVWSEMPSPEAIYRFLRRALREVDKGLPLRGPLGGFDEGEWTYRATRHGSLEAFDGSEMIGYRIRVYECWFHGGMLRAK